jgi:beta-fructofuranosidase
MNDPNGLIQHNGHYHIFYQYNPNGAFWGTMHWGHAMSEDLVNWRHMPIALTPDADGPDRDGCYSGAAVVHEGVPTLVYTGVRDSDQLPCLAMSEDPDLAKWKTFSGNPVLRGTPASVQTTIFRDHTLWREEGGWMMGVGSGIVGEGGAVLLYRSRDLVTWQYLHPLAVEDPALNSTGELLSTGWECPDFFVHGDKAALIACDWDGNPISVSYWTGEYQDQRFVAHYKGVVDAGSPFYAPQSFVDATGRRLMFGWLMEARSDAAQRDAGWSGVMSLPRVITMQGDGTLAFSVAPEVESLRGRCLEVQPGKGIIDLDGLPGDALEIRAVFSGAGAEEIGVDIRCAPDDSEATLVRWNAASRTLSLDTRTSSLDPDVTGELASATVDLADNEPLTLRIFVDRSVVEIYANERIALSGRVYPAREDSLHVRAIGADRLCQTITFYEMMPAGH